MANKLLILQAKPLKLLCPPGVPRGDNRGDNRGIVFGQSCPGRIRTPPFDADEASKA